MERRTTHLDAGRGDAVSGCHRCQIARVSHRSAGEIRPVTRFICQTPAPDLFSAAIRCNDTVQQAGDYALVSMMRPVVEPCDAGSMCSRF